MRVPKSPKTPNLMKDDVTKLLKTSADKPPRGMDDNLKSILLAPSSRLKKLKKGLM